MGNAQEKRCRLIVGLGNPGAEYAATRHNAGWQAVDRFLAKYPSMFRPRNARSAEAYEGSFAGSKLILLKPLTFMNLSGEALAPAMRGENLVPDEILVVYDDIDLPVGRIRIRKRGGSAGHNGLKSIIGSIGTESFPRLRIGIGEEGARRNPDYVLSGFSGEEAEKYSASLDRAVSAIELILRRDYVTAMNFCNPPAVPEDKETNKETANKTKTTEEIQP